jgi:hypothetical protein
MFAATLSLNIVPAILLFILVFGCSYAWHQYRDRGTPRDEGTYPQSHVHMRSVPYDWEEDVDARWSRGAS